MVYEFTGVTRDDNERELRRMAAELEALRAERDELIAALQKVICILTLEDNLNPSYGWMEWLQRNVLPALSKYAKGE